jgi:signal peptidase I
MLVITALVIAALWCARRRYVVVTVAGHSMMPTLRDGQRLIARRTRRSERLARGQIIVFVPPVLPVPIAERFTSDVVYRVKRIVAIAGDPAPPWLPALVGGQTLVRVPPGMVAVLGDNPRSADSREYGCVPERAILALVGRAARETSPGSPDLRSTARRASP